MKIIIPNEYHKETIPVYSPYGIRDTIMPAVEKYIVCMLCKHPKRYNPFMKMKEIISFSRKLDLDNNEDILEFCNRYGMLNNTLTFEEHILFSKKHGKDFNEFHDLKERLTIREEAVQDFFPTNQELKNALTFGFKYTMHQIKQLIEIMASNDVWKYHNALPIVNTLLGGVRINIAEIQADFITSYSYEHLPQAIGVFFYKTILNKGEIRFCIQCGYPFTPKKKYQPGSKSYQICCSKICHYDYSNNRKSRKSKGGNQ